MKLHLPKSLFTALLTCCSLATSVVTTVASSTLLVGAISFTLVPQEAQGEILEFQGTNGFVHGTDWKRADGSIVGGLAQYAAYFTNTPQNIMKFDNPTGSFTTAAVQFNVISLGGIWVTDASANVYTLDANGSRNINWRASTAADVATMGADAVAGKVNLIINNDFNIGTGVRFADMLYAAGMNFAIASGKTLNLVADEMTTLGDAPAAGSFYEHVVQNSGTLNLNLNNYDLSRGANWTVQEGSTVHMSNVSAGGTVSFGALTMDNGIINMGTGNATLSSQMVVGAGGATITGGHITNATTTTLSGSIDLSAGGGLTLSGKFALAEGIVFNLGGASVASDEYTLFTRAAGSQVDFSLADITIANLDYSIRLSSIAWDASNNLIATIEDMISFAQGDLTWDNDAATTPWTLNGAAHSFAAGEIVGIGADGSTGGTISINENVAPQAVLVHGDGAWTFTGTGGITGSARLVKEGASTLTIQNSNSYTGGTTITEGTVVLAAANAAGSGDITLDGASATLEIGLVNALHADSMINYTAGTIKYGAGITASFHDKITVEGGAMLTLDINGNDVTWGEAIAGNFSILNTGAAAAAFDYSYSVTSKTVNVGTNATVVSTTSGDQANGVTLTGDGIFRIENTGTYTVGNIDNFTGTLQATNGGVITIIRDMNTADKRFALETEDEEAQATEVQAIVLADAQDQTLYLDKLSGYSTITVTYDDATNRGLDLEMTENNTFHGNFRAGNSTDHRWGTITIGGDGMTFNWTGMSTQGTAYGSLGDNSSLLIKEGATMNFSSDGDSGGQFADEIAIEERGKLLISRTDATGFVQRATGNEISGAGSVEVSGKATLTGANTYTGGTVVNDEGTLTSNSLTALGTGNIEVQTGGSLTLAAGFTQGASQTLTNAGSLTIDGTLALTSTLTNTGGTVTLLANTIFNLAGLTADEDDVSGVKTYTLFSSDGTLVFSALSATGALDLTQIAGIDSSGYNWQINADGTITATLDANTLFYSTGGDLSWNTADADFDGDLSFADTNSVVFQDANVNITLEQDIEAGFIRIVGIVAELDGAGFTLTTDRILIDEGGTFIQKGSSVAAGADFIGELGNTLVLDLGAGESITRNDELVGFKGELIVRSGNLTINNHTVAQGMDFEKIIVEAGASLTSTAVSFAEAADIPLELQGGADATSSAVWNTGNVSFFGTLTTSGYATLNLSDNVLNLRDTVTSRGNLTINGAAHNVQFFSSLSGDGSIVKTGSGALIFTEANQMIDHTGTLSIQEGSLTLGDSYGDTMTVRFEEIIMAAGTTLNTAMNAAGDISATNLVLQGATVNHGNFDATGDGVVQWRGLELTGDNNFNVANKGSFEFGTVTGTGNLTVGGAFSDAGQNNYIQINNLVDFAGTLTGSTNDQFSLVINSAQQGAGVEGVISGSDVDSTGFSIAGEGKLTINTNLVSTGSVAITDASLTVKGNVSATSFKKDGAGTVSLGSLTLVEDGALQMSYDGSMTISNYTLTGDLRLTYTNLTSVLTLAEGDLGGVTGMYLDLVGYQLEDLDGEGIKLGIANSSKDDITILGLTGGYSLNEGADGYLSLTSSVLPDVGWDANWGQDVLGQRPVTVPVVTDLGNETTYLYGNATYTEGSVTRIELKGGGGAAAQVIGGNLFDSNAAATVVETDVWIKATGGEFLLIAGGNIANNWQNSNIIEFRGDTHIEVDGANVGHIVGGSLREGGHSLFTGDSYISVFTDTVTGSIIGAGTARHNNGTGRKTTFTGDSNIYVYTPLTLSTAGATAAEGLTNDSIIGGHHWSVWDVTYTFNGNSNISIDLRDYTGGVATMVKSIIGAGRVGAGSVYNHTGDTYITIKGNADVTFDDWVMGGIWHVSNSPTSTLTGNTHIEISGDSIFTQRVTGGANHGNGSATITESTNVTITGGDFRNHVIAGFNQHDGTTSIGSTNLTIGGGSYLYKVIAGNLQANGTSTIHGNTNLTITAGTFGGDVHGGGVDLNQALTANTLGSHLITVSGGTFNGRLVGGSQIAENFSGIVSVAGGVTMDIDGGTFNGMIIGGHIRTAGTLASDTSMGAVNMSLSGAEVKADLYAAGHLAAALAGGDMSVTESTSVTLASDITFTAGVTVSGGFGGAGAASGEVTGDRKLVFGDAASTYGNIADVEFSDFNVLEVSDAGSTVSLAGSLASLDSSVEKTGAGTLALAAVNHATALTVSAGTVKLAANSQANTITSIDVVSGAALDMTQSSTGINGALTLRGGSSMSITTGEAGAAIGSGSLTLIGAETTRINLTIEGLSYTAGMDITETLFSGIASGSQIDGIDLTKQLDNGMPGVLASNYLTITGIADLSNMYLAYDDANDSLILTNVINSTLVWGGGNGAWAGLNEWTKDGALATFKNNDNVIFNATNSPLTGVVTVGGEVTVTDMSFEGNGNPPSGNVAYTFNGALITVTGDLSVHGGASATFSNIGLAAADVEIGASSTLTLKGGATVYSLDNVGTLSVGSVGESRDFTISTATEKGGNLTVSGNLVLTGDANSFGVLDVGGNVTTTGALTMAQGSSVSGAFGGTALTITGADETSSTSVASVTDDFAALTNANGSLTIGGAVSVAQLVNTGHVILESAGTKYDLTLTDVSSQGGKITAKNLTLAGDATATNTFGVIDIAQYVRTDSLLSIGAGSNIGYSLKAEGLTITGGDATSRTTVTRLDGQSLTSLTNSAGTLEIAEVNLTVTGAFSNAGTVIVDDDFELDTVTTNGGSVEANNVTLVGGDTFNSITTTPTGSITSEGALTLNGASTAGKLVGVTDLSVGTSLTVNDTAITTVNSLAGAGSLTVGGTLQTAAASSIGELTFFSSLNLGGNLTVDRELKTTSTSMIVNVYYTGIKTTPLITAASLGGAIEVNFDFEDDDYLSGLKMSSGETIVLLDTTDDSSTLTSARINTDTTYSLGSYLYEIKLVNGDVELTATLTGNTWESSTGTWSSVDSWSDSTPDASNEAIFSGEGTSSVTIAGAVTASHITVDIADGSSVGAYTLSGAGQLTTGEFTLNKGGFSIETQVDIVDEIGGAASTGALTLNGSSLVTVADGGVVTAATASMGADNKLSVLEGGSLTIEGALAGAEGTVENRGKLSLGSGSSLKELTGSGELAITGAVGITTARAGSLSGTGDLTVEDIILDDAGSVLGSLTAGSITLNAVLSSTEAQLTVSSLHGTDIALDMVGFDHSIDVGSYTIIAKGGATDLSWDSLTLSADDRDAFNQYRLRGFDVVRDDDDGNIKIVVTKALGRVWDTANLFAVTPGLEDVDPSMKVDVIGADGKILSYEALNTVHGVIVTQDVTVDLRDLTLDPSDSLGLVIRNLGGMTGKTMTIIGASEADSLATLVNNKDSMGASIVAQDVTLNTIPDGSFTLELTALEMESSALNVQAGIKLSIGSVELDESIISVAENGKLTLGSVNLVNSSKLEEAEGGQFIVDSLSGDASSSVAGQIEVKGNDGNFQGVYETPSTVLVKTGASQTLTVDDNLSVLGEQGAHITLNLTDTRHAMSSIQTTGSTVLIQGNTPTTPLYLAADSALTEGELRVSLDADHMLTALQGAAAVETILTGSNARSRSAGSSLTLDGVAIYVSALSGGKDTGLLDLSGLSQTQGVVIGVLHDNIVDQGHSIFLDGATMNKFFTNIRLLADGSIVVDFNREGYGSMAQTVNGAAGLGLMSEAIITLNSELTGSEPQYQDLADVTKSLDSYLASGDAAGADKLAAAVAGSSVTSLGSSMLASVDQQLKSARNRTTSMGGNNLTIKGEPVFGAWISAEGSKNTLDGDGTSSGHDYDAWGGSLGVYTDLSESFTMGMAFTVLTGSVDSDAVDIASGDLNTYGISAYAVKLDGRWSHTFVASANMADATLDRTVTHANGSYTTSGSTDGYGLGLMYEVGYTYALSEDNSTSWQPIFNVALVHASMSGYEETGSDAALTVGDQSSTYVSFGLGGRIETAFGENLVNRKAVLSGRAMLKLDAGSRYTDADVALSKNSGATRNIEGAEAGAFGVELGAGLKVPVGIESGVIFMDAGLELRSGMNNMNASVGYQFQF